MCSSLTYFIITRYESEYIKNITSTIANRISNCKPLFVGDNLVGMDSHFKKISLGLRMESNDVRMVGICGIGGIGKTTIAGYIYIYIYIIKFLGDLNVATSLMSERFTKIKVYLVYKINFLMIPKREQIKR